jgi:Polysaccharide deacetylase
MARWIAVAMLGVCLKAGATSYYVSNGGADGNNGTSAATAWRTLAHVNAQTFAGGDTIYLQRGGIWREPLIPPSSGTSGNPIKFDAYGSGAAPIITAATPIAFDDDSWAHVEGGNGNTWKAAIASLLGAGTVNMVEFGKVYGRKQPYGTGCQYSIVSKYDWCVVWPNLYVYSPSGTNPIVTYASDGGIVPIVSSASGLQMIYVNGKSWLTFQHIRVQEFDYVGVGVAGSSDHLVFANMESVGMVPYGTTPLGFFVNASPAPGDIQFLNDDAYLNYDGFKIDGAAVAITVRNCRGYANRDAGLKDNTGGHVTYSYSHFYGNNIAQFPASDVVGAVAGVGNVWSGLAPVVRSFNSYPARFSFTVDDVGSSAGTEEYVNSLLPIFTSRGLKVNAAVVPSYAVDWQSVNNWYGAGHEIDAHSWSHQYYTTNTNPQAATPYPNAPALDLRYTGTGTAATVTVAGTVLSTNVTGGGAEILNVDLTEYDTIEKLESYLASQPSYSVAYDTSGPLVRPNTHCKNLLNVANRDIKNSTAVLVYDQTKLVPDEMLWSKATIESKVLGSSISFYVYPDGIQDSTTEVDAIAAGYSGARGSLAMKGQDNVTASANSVYANGVNVQNITSLGAIQIHGLTAAEIDRMAANLVFRASVWGAPYGFFTHFNSRGDDAPDVTNGEVGEFLDSITEHGGSVLTNTELARTITSGTNFSGGTRWIQNPSRDETDLGVATAGSATVGSAMVTAYPIDINGTDRALLKSWDIGASTYISQRYGTGGGSGQWVMR